MDPRDCVDVGLGPPLVTLNAGEQAKRMEETRRRETWERQKHGKAETGGSEIFPDGHFLPVPSLSPWSAQLYSMDFVGNHSHKIVHHLCKLAWLGFWRLPPPKLDKIPSSAPDLFLFWTLRQILPCVIVVWVILFLELTFKFLDGNKWILVIPKGLIVSWMFILFRAVLTGFYHPLVNRRGGERRKLPGVF